MKMRAVYKSCVHALLSVIHSLYKFMLGTSCHAKHVLRTEIGPERAQERKLSCEKCEESMK